MADKITLYLGPYRQGKTNVILAKALANITSYGYSNLTYIIVPSQRSADIIKEKLLTLAKTQSIITGFKIQTFYQFCKMLINKLNCPVLICKNDLRLSMLLNGCSQVQTSESDFINLTSGLGKDLLTLIDEFERAFLTPSEILQILAVNFHGNAKFTNLAKIYKCYWDKLNSLKYLDERQLVFQLIQIISQQSNFNLGDIIIDGFDRFNKLQLQFLTQLLPCANNITMSFDYAQSNGFSNNEYQWKQFSYDLISQQYAKYFNIINVNDENNFRLRQLEIYEAFDFNDEISTIARQIKDLIINQQYSLNDILVVVANLKYYTNTIDYIFNDSKIPYYLDDNINLAESSIIKCLINLLTLPLNNFSRLELLNLIKSPFFKTVIFNDVDILDQMEKKMTTIASSRRWPLHKFYNILDLSGINSYILYTEVTGEKISRRKFLLRLAEELWEMVTEQKVSNSTTSKKVNKKRKTCFASNCNNKTTNQCIQCEKFVCGKHSINSILCCNCL